MANLIESSLLSKKNIKLVRFHQSGDFFNQNYFDAWLMVAENNPQLLFYGYTKALPFWAKRLNQIPSNFKLVASRGGSHDYLIEPLGFRSVKVVYSEEEAIDLNLEIDHDDSHCWQGDKSFAVLIHGTQPPGSKSGKALSKLRKLGKGGYKTDYFGHYADKQRGKKEYKYSPLKSALDIRSVNIALK